jgi:hypothetical protein
VWLRPPDLPHPDGVWDAPLRRYVFAAVAGIPGVQTPRRGFARSTVEGPLARRRLAKRHPRTGFGCFLSFGSGSTVWRTSAIPGGQWTSVRRPSHRVRNRIVRERSSSEVGRRSSRNRGHLPIELAAPTHLSVALRSFWGWSRDRSVEDLPPVVLRLAWTHSSECSHKGRSSLASFGTHLPTSNGPFWSRRASADVIFGWQTRRPRTARPGVTDLCRRHLRVTRTAASISRMGAADMVTLSFGRARSG